MAGLKDATTDEAVIARWWQTWPQANIGVATGPQSGLVVLDIDAGKNGTETLAELESTHEKLPDTVEAITGSGGRHILFAHPNISVKNSVRKLGPGIDVRGDGGYIVVAPSLHKSGQRYAWEASSEPEATPLASVPSWLLGMIVDQSSNGKSLTNGHRADPIDEKISHGARNATLASFAGTMRRRGASEDVILAALLAMNEAQCNPPLSDTDVRKIATSISRYEPSEPLEQPADLDAAQPILDGLRELADGTEAVRLALEPETLGALALAADEDRGAFETLLLDLRAKGARARDIDAVQRAVRGEQRKRRQLRIVRANEESALPRVKAALEHAPVPDQTVVPPGWRIGPSGIARESVSDDHGQQGVSVVSIAPSPVLIAGRLKDVSDGTEAIRLAYLRDERWQHHTTGRAVVANARSLVELAGVGIPVTSGTSGDLASYLAAFEAANIALLPRAHVSRQMGWQGEDGRLGFLWGRTLIRPDGEQTAMVDLERLAPEDWQEDWIAFHGDDAGDEQLADGYHAQGNLDGWRSAVAVVGSYPRAALALYAALAPPLLMVFRARNFANDWSYTTSTGKTTVLRLGASCWGCPDERAPAAALTTWDASRVWIERASAVLNGLPLILDDTKRAKNTKLIAQTIYDVVSGRGRGRGSTHGMRRIGTWQTVMLSSGESPITSFSEDGGTRARVLAVWGLPFERADAATAQIVRTLDLAVRQHYGHAGPALVRFILTHRDDWEEWRAEYQRVQMSYLQRAGDNAVAGRLADSFAMLDMTAGLAHVALGLPWKYRDPIDSLWDGLIAEANEADRASAALTYVLSWAHGHPSSFYGRHRLDTDGQPKVPNDGWAGRWDSDSKWDFIAFLPHKIRALLADPGFDVESVIRIWFDRGWLIVRKGSGRAQQVKARINGESAWTIAIRREAFAEANVEDEPATEDTLL